VTGKMQRQQSGGAMGLYHKQQKVSELFESRGCHRYLHLQLMDLYCLSDEGKVSTGSTHVAKLLNRVHCKKADVG
jgi:hypothetical protein